MAYKQKGCSPITAKIKRTTQGGMVTQPILNMGAPVKMKMSSPAKDRYDGQSIKKGEDGLGTIGGNQKANNAMQAIPSDDISMTPYSVKKEYANLVELNPKVKKTGVIHGPKVSYDMAYEKAKKTKRYAGMSKADYIKEAKRQTKSFTGTGNWDAKPKKRKKVAAVSTIKSTGIKPLSVETKLTGKIDAAVIKPKGKKVEPTKKQTRKTKSIDKKLAKAKTARDAGNIKKAERKERAAERKAARVARRATKAAKTSVAKQTQKQKASKKAKTAYTKKLNKSARKPGYVKHPTYTLNGEPLEYNPKYDPKNLITDQSQKRDKASLKDNK